jgi:hypothetical protein
MIFPAFKRLGIAALVWFEIAASAVFGRTQQKIGLNGSFWTGFDDNAFRNYQMLSDVVYQPNAGLYYSRVTDRSGFRADYEGSLALFKNFMNRRFQHHFLGVSGNRLMGGSGNMTLYWGLRGGKRWNEQDYAYYDYGNGSAYLNLRYDRGGSASAGLGFSGQVQQYRELGQFNFHEFRSYFQPSLTLPTRTTLIGQFQIGFKKFTEPVESEELIREIRTVKTGGNSQGKGRGNAGNPNRDTTRTVVVERTVTLTSPGESVTQFTGLVRAAQAVFEGTGVAVQGMVRRNLKRDGRVLSYQDSGYEPEDVLFDDPYSYESDEFLLEATQMLPWAMSLKAGIDIRDKRYDYAAGGAGGAMRRDKRSGFWLTLKKTVRMGVGPSQAALSFSFSSTNNRSNDAYYDYTNKVSSVGMSFGI